MVELKLVATTATAATGRGSASVIGGCGGGDAVDYASTIVWAGVWTIGSMARPMIGW